MKRHPCASRNCLTRAQKFAHCGRCRARGADSITQEEAVRRDAVAAERRRIVALVRAEAAEREQRPAADVVTRAFNVGGASALLALVAKVEGETT